MKRKLFYLAAITMIAVLGISVASCDKDSDNPIVGTWSCSNHYYGGSYGGTDTYVFKSNGTYTWSCTGDWWDDESGKYTYSEKDGLLIIERSTTEIYYVLSLTESSFTIMDEDGDKYTYYKK